MASFLRVLQQGHVSFACKKKKNRSRDIWTASKSESSFQHQQKQRQLNFRYTCKTTSFILPVYNGKQHH